MLLLREESRDETNKAEKERTSKKKVGQQRNRQVQSSKNHKPDGVSNWPAHIAKQGCTAEMPNGKEGEGSESDEKGTYKKTPLTF